MFFGYEVKIYPTRVRGLIFFCLLKTGLSESQQQISSRRFPINQPSLKSSKVCVVDIYTCGHKLNRKKNLKELAASLGMPGHGTCIRSAICSSRRIISGLCVPLFLGFDETCLSVLTLSHSIIT